MIWWRTGFIPDPAPIRPKIRGLRLPVYWGNRNWAPYLEEAVQDAAASGHSNLLALATSAYSSFSSCRQYREDFARVLDVTGLGGSVTIDKVRQFFDHPGFVQPFIDGVRDAIGGFLADGLPPESVRVLFSTHSIPTADAERSGPRAGDPHHRAWGEGGAYAAQHLAVAEVVMSAVAAEIPAAARVGWELVYQSRSARPPSRGSSPTSTTSSPSCRLRGCRRSRSCRSAS